MALTNRDAAIVLGMVARGDKRHDIAAWFGENQARIAEIEQGSHGSIAAAPATDLPPKGADLLSKKLIYRFEMSIYHLKYRFTI